MLTRLADVISGLVCMVCSCGRSSPDIDLEWGTYAKQSAFESAQTPLPNMPISSMFKMSRCDLMLCLRLEHPYEHSSKLDARAASCIRRLQRYEELVKEQKQKCSMQPMPCSCTFCSETDPVDALELLLQKELQGEL